MVVLRATKQRKRELFRLIELNKNQKNTAVVAELYELPFLCFRLCTSEQALVKAASTAHGFVPKRSHPSGKNNKKQISTGTGTLTGTVDELKIKI
ncbi:MAG: hypothetical protein J6Z41_05840 [Prevotella sp.]|nr:hypothetical protein [Prevotella sp.]